MRMSRFSAAITVVVLLGAGCFGAHQLSPLGRVTAAFPLPPQLETRRNETLMALPWEHKLPFLLELHRRVTVRAQTCARDYSPPWAAPLDEVILSLPDISCFRDADDELARWIGFMRLGPVLRQAPLRPVPTTVAERLTDRTALQAAHFPTRAGVVLLEQGTDLAVLDLATGRRLHTLRKGAATPGRVSPNGRVVLLGEEHGSRVMETETGVVLAELPGVQPASFFWIDERTAVFSPMRGSAVLMVDFATGRELPLPGQTRRLEAAMPVPDAPDQFVAGYARAASKFRIDRSVEQPRITRVATRRFDVDWDYDEDGITAGGAHYLAADGGLAVLDLRAMESRTLELDPFHAEQVIPTDSPNRVVLRGTVPFDPHAGTRCYVYDLADDTLAPLTCGETSASQPLYLLPLQRFGTIDQYGVEPADIPYAPALPVSEQVAAWQDEAAEHQRRQAALEEDRRQRQLAEEQSRLRAREHILRTLRESEQSLSRMHDPERRRQAQELLRSHIQRLQSP